MRALASSGSSSGSSPGSGSVGGFLQRLSARDRRALLAGVLILGPALAWVYGVRPFRAALEEARDRVAAEQELLLRERGLLGRETALRQALEAARARANDLDRRLLHAPTEVLAEGELTQFLEGAAYRSRVLLEDISSGRLDRGEEPPAGLSLVRLHLRGESDLEGVLTFLDEIERSELLLRVRGLALEPEMARPEGEGEEGNQAAVPTGVVRLQLIVDGFVRIEELQS